MSTAVTYDYGTDTSGTIGENQRQRVTISLPRKFLPQEAVSLRDYGDQDNESYKHSKWVMKIDNPNLGILNIETYTTRVLEDCARSTSNISLPSTLEIQSNNDISIASTFQTNYQFIIYRVVTNQPLSYNYTDDVPYYSLEKRAVRIPNSEVFAYPDGWPTCLRFSVESNQLVSRKAIIDKLIPHFDAIAKTFNTYVK